MFSTIYQWILAHFGVDANLLATLAMAIGIFNLVMSAVQSVFNRLKLAEPTWLQKIGSVGASIAGWLSANIPSVKKQIDGQ